jgi:hypothetical protein
VAVDELSDKSIREMMTFYTKYRVEYDFMKVCLPMQKRPTNEKETYK